MSILSACGLGAQAQDLVTASRPPVTSRDELVSRLRAALRPADDWTGAQEYHVQIALIASWGEPVPTWALELAQEDTLDQLLRVAAFQVLYYARPQRTVATLLRLAEPRGDTSFAWSMAMEALQSFPYNELAPFWRRMLGHRNVSVRLFALSGLSMCGTEGDVALVLSVQGGGALGRAREEAVARLRLLPEERGRALFAGPPTPDARFVPSAIWLRDARAILCRVGRCPP